MTIRLKATGEVFKGASWLGHSWLRWWVPQTTTERAGWLHYPRHAVEIISDFD